MTDDLDYSAIADAVYNEYQYDLQIDELNEKLIKLEQTLVRLTEENKILKEALEFYANVDNYDSHQVWGKVCVLDNDTTQHLNIKCGGRRARIALAKLNNRG